jgi:hypothetical protein
MSNMIMVVKSNFNLHSSRKKVLFLFFFDIYGSVDFMFFYCFEWHFF